MPHSSRGTVTGILVLTKMVLGPTVLAKLLVPPDCFSRGKNGPTLKIWVPRTKCVKQKWRVLSDPLHVTREGLRKGE